MANGKLKTFTPEHLICLISAEDRLQEAFHYGCDLHTDKVQWGVGLPMLDAAKRYSVDYDKFAELIRVKLGGEAARLFLSESERDLHDDDMVDDDEIDDD